MKQEIYSIETCKFNNYLLKDSKFSDIDIDIIGYLIRKTGLTEEDILKLTDE